MKNLIIVAVSMLSLNSFGSETGFEAYAGARGVTSGTCVYPWENMKPVPAPQEVTVSSKQIKLTYASGKSVIQDMSEFSESDDGAAMYGTFLSKNGVAIYQESHSVGTLQSFYVIKLSRVGNKILLHQETRDTNIYKSFNEVCDLTIE